MNIRNLTSRLKQLSLSQQGLILVFLPLLISGGVQAAPTSAANDGFFAGLAVTYQEASTDWSTDGLLESEDESFTDTESGFALVGGYQQGSHRYSLAVSHASHEALYWSDIDGIDEKDHVLTNLIAQYDYLFPVASNFSIYGGLHLGMVHSDIETTLGDDTTIGALYGLQLGANFAFTPQWSADLSYHWSQTSVEHSVTEVIETFEIEIDQISGFRLGVSYHF